MTDVEILVHVLECSEEQAEHMLYTFERIGIGEILDLRRRHEGNIHFILTSPEGEFSLSVNVERELTGIRGPSITRTRGLSSLYSNQMTNICADYPEGRFMEDEIRRTLINSDAERQFYFDQSYAMIASIQEFLVVQEQWVLTRTPIGAYERPESFSYHGDWFVSRRAEDGIVEVSLRIYGNIPGQRPVDFGFDIEFAMLHPVSFRLSLFIADNPEMIYWVWNGDYYDSMHTLFDELREEAANHTDSFSEDEMNYVRYLLHRFW